MKWRSNFSFDQLNLWEENARLQLIAGLLPWILRTFQLILIATGIAIIFRPTIWQYWLLTITLLTSIYISTRSIKHLNKGDWRNSTFLLIIAMFVAALGANVLIQDTTIIVALVILLITILGGIQYSAKAGYMFAIVLIVIGLTLSFSFYMNWMYEVDYRIAQPRRDIMKFAVAAIMITIGAKLVFLDHQNMKTAVSRIADQANKLQQANKQLEEMNLIKTKFMSAVSHELRTPVTNLILHLELLTRGKPEKRSSYIKILGNQTTRLQCLIEKILHLTRLDMLNNVEKITSIEFNQLISENIAKYQTQAQEAGINLLFSPSKVSAIQGNVDYLNLAISNLIENGIKYTKNGSVQIITSHKFDKELDTSFVQCQIIDTGLGVSSEELAHVFDRFYRGKAAQETSSAGFGIGLSIVKKVIELHRGQIHVNNQENGEHGFVVTLLFPVT